MNDRQREFEFDESSSYFDTTHLSGDELATLQTQAARQEREIVAMMRQHPTQTFTPWEVFEHFREWPITSIRRAMTTATHRGLLVKTTERRRGPLGRLSYAWRVSRDGRAALDEPDRAES